MPSVSSELSTFGLALSLVSVILYNLCCILEPDLDVLV
jgi:hypothetical protein